MSADEHDKEGRSPAAWTMVAIMLVGAAVMAVAVAFPSHLWFGVGVLVVVVGGVVGKLMSMAGYGVKGKPGQTQQTSGVH